MYCYFNNFGFIYFHDWKRVKNYCSYILYSSFSAYHCFRRRSWSARPDGAVSQNGISEEQINLQIVLKIQELLESSNCNVILTRSDENGIYDSNAKSKKASDLNNRVEIINSSNADCLVSIHLNKISAEQYYGWQSFYQKNNEQSINLAKSIQSSLNYSTRHRK